MKHSSRLLAAALLLSAVAAPSTRIAAQAPAQPVEQRVKHLHELLREHWEYTLRTSPEFASILGDKRYNDRWSDFSQAAIDRDIEQTRAFLKKFESVDTAGFPEQERLNRDLMVRDLRLNLEGIRFKGWEMPVSQFGGIQIDLPQLVSSFPFSTVKDYEDYLARLRQVPRVFDETTVQMRKGMADGLMPPKILLVQVAEQTEGIARQKPEESPFAEPLKKFPKEISEADQKRLREGITAALRDQVLPTYAKFLAFVRDEYAPKGRTDIGIWSLPDGAARYALAVRRMTTTDMTPEEIHQLGLREVARIESEELAIARKLGFKDLKSFGESLKKNPEVHPKSRQQILDEFRRYTDQMWALLPKLFGRLPKARLEILPVEAFREKQASTSYNQGTPDGSRPGHVFVNTYDYENQLTISNESTAYHEGVPGHHMQISIAQELPELPPFRQQAGYTAFVEGWALYSERLGKELGFYQNPYNDYGRLEDEMLRAIRLVVDTGIHYKRWTREQVVQFFRDHYNSNDAYIQAETDRYIAWPGQALAYKIGQLTFLRLREKAGRELGPKFDIRAFHDEALGAGALPMDVLEQRINAWIARAKAGEKGAAAPANNPRLPVAATASADPMLFPPDTRPLPFGDPKSVTPSQGTGGGTGEGTGVGPGRGGGIGTGEGEGTGFGPGRGSNDIGGGGPGGPPVKKDVYTTREVETRAKILSKPEPEYTEKARKNNTNGTVLLKAVLAADGTVQRISVVKGLPDGLSEKAIAAARLIKFTPARKYGQPVSQWVTVEYNFNTY